MNLMIIIEQIIINRKMQLQRLYRERRKSEMNWK